MASKRETNKKEKNRTETLKSSSFSQNYTGELNICFIEKKKYKYEEEVKRLKDCYGSWRGKQEFLKERP